MANNVVNSIKLIVQSGLRRFGWEIKRVNSSEMNQVLNIINQTGVDLVIDVGANEGQYAQSLIDLGYRQRIVSFEPQSVAHQKLISRSRRFGGWEIAPRLAVGDSPGQVEINISGNSVSSSILGMEAIHLGNAPGSEYISKETVQLVTLDDCNCLPVFERAMLKVDTQGFEMFVLRGASRLLKRVTVVQLEVSLAKLYSGQPSISEILEFMDRNDFVIWGIFPGFFSKETGRLLQADFMFVSKMFLNDT